MITKWRLDGFKSAETEIELEFGELTVFLGANSSGKSTILQSMLFVAQSVSERVPGRQLIVNGRLARLGDFSEIQTRGRTLPIHIGGTVSAERMFRFLRSDTIRGFARELIPFATEIYQTFSFDIRIDKGKEANVRSLLQPRIVESRVSLIGEVDKQQIQLKESPRTRSARIEELLGSASHESARGSLGIGLDYELDGPQNVGEEAIPWAKAEIVGAILDGIIPSSLVCKFSQTQTDARMLVDALCGRRRHRELSNRLLALVDDKLIAELKVMLRAVKRRRDSSPVLAGLDAADVKTPIDDMTSAELLNYLLGPSMPGRYLGEDSRERLMQTAVAGRVDTMSLARVPCRPESKLILDLVFGRLFHYLGPLREEPRSLYPMSSGLDPDDVGTRGEHTAAVLDLHKDTGVRFVPPAAYSEQGESARVASASLQDAVQQWMSYLGVVESIQTSDLEGGLGHRLQVSPRGGDKCQYSLVHVGVGVSQVLPILVMSLLAPAGSILVFEQPELHLHPAVQSRLADFFLALMISGRQCIIETHSEYLLSRLRLRCAEAQNPRYADRLRLFFVSPSASGSSYNMVRITEYGRLSEWPAGFFDWLPQEAESIMRAAAKKKSKPIEGA